MEKENPFEGKDLSQCDLKCVFDTLRKDLDELEEKQKRMRRALFMAAEIAAKYQLSKLEDS